MVYLGISLAPFLNDLACLLNQVSSIFGKIDNAHEAELAVLIAEDFTQARSSGDVDT